MWQHSFIPHLLDYFLVDDLNIAHGVDGFVILSKFGNIKKSVHALCVA